METICGITNSGRHMHLQELCEAKGSIDFQGGHTETTDKDLWEQLEPGEIGGGGIGTTANLKASLINEARQHSWVERCEEFLGQRVSVPTALGIGVPYAAGPMIRAVARAVVAETARNLFAKKDPRHWGGQVLAPVFTVETPVAVAIERHANGDYGTFGMISWGCGRIEFTIIVVMKDQISVRAFRECSPECGAKNWKELTEIADPPICWLVLSPAESILNGEVPRIAKIKNASLAEASRGVARYAFARHLPDAIEALPQIDRIVPRALGIVARNRVGALFWHRLLNVGDTWSGHSWVLNGKRDDLGSITAACWTDGSCNKRWLPQSQWQNYLHWWQEPLPALPLATAAIDHVHSLRLTCLEAEDGYRLANTSLDGAVVGRT